MLGIPEDLFRLICTDWLGDVVSLVKLERTCRWINKFVVLLFTVKGITLRGSMSEQCPHQAVLWLLKRKAFLIDVYLKFSVYKSRNCPQIMNAEFDGPLAVFCGELKGLRVDKLYWNAQSCLHFLSRSCNLISLVFTNSDLSSGDLLKVMKLLPNSLTRIDLEGCKEMSQRCTDEIVLRCPKLNCIGLSGCTKLSSNDLVKFLSELPPHQITSLDLSMCGEGVNDRVLSALVGRHWRHLTWLNISDSYNVLSDATVVTLVHICVQLRELHMNQCPNVSMDALLHAEYVISQRALGERTPSGKLVRLEDTTGTADSNSTALVLDGAEEDGEAGERDETGEKHTRRIGVTFTVELTRLEGEPSQQLVHFEKSRILRLCLHLVASMRHGVTVFCDVMGGSLQRHWLFHLLFIVVHYYDFTGVFVLLRSVLQYLGADESTQNFASHDCFTTRMTCTYSQVAMEMCAIMLRGWAIYFFVLLVLKLVVIVRNLW